MNFTLTVLNLVWLLVLYVPSESSFISTRFLILNLDARFAAFSKKFIVFIFHYYIIIYCQINLRSLIILCLFPGYIYLSLGIFLATLIFSVSFVTVSDLSCDEVLENFVILLAILLPIKSPVASEEVASWSRTALSSCFHYCISTIVFQYIPWISISFLCVTIKCLNSYIFTFNF